MKKLLSAKRVSSVSLFLLVALLVVAGNKKRTQTTMPPATVHADTIPPMQVDTLPPADADTLHRTVFQVPPSILPIHHK